MKAVVGSVLLLPHLAEIHSCSALQNCNGRTTMVELECRSWILGCSTSA